MTAGPRLCPTELVQSSMELPVGVGVGAAQQHRAPAAQGSELRQPGLEPSSTSH